MRHVLVVVAVAAGLAGCGGLDNRVLSEGQLRVAVPLSELEAGKAWVALPALGRVAFLGDAGVAAFAQLEPGPVDVVLLASREKGVVLRAQVRARETVDLGTVALARTQRLLVELSAQGDPDLGKATATLRGLPLGDVRADDEGEFELGPVPPGCFDVDLRVPGYGELSASACTTSDGGASTRVALPEPTGQVGREGCLVTGCRDGKRCGPRFVCE